MKRTWIFVAALGLCVGLAAYGVSPSQYTAGKAQDAQVTGSLPQAPQPMYAQGPQPVPMSGVAPGPQPVPGNAVGPGGAPPINVSQPPQGPQNYDAMAIPDWAKEWKHYHWEVAKAMWEKKDALFCDARGKSEYDQGHIPGAIPLPVAEFDKYYEMYKSKIKKAKHLVTYCHGVGCQLSNKVAQKLYKDKGYKDVGSFFGGWPQWQQHNMPVETGPEPKPR